MHWQLEEIAAEFRAARDRLHRLAAAAPDALWSRRPAEGRWSAAECVDHLNRTSERFLPPVRELLASARERGQLRAGDRRFRRGLIGGMLWRAMSPPVRLMRVRTSASFVGTGAMPPDQLRARFDALQTEQLACVEAADGLDLERLMLVSPFDGRVSYNAFACLGILARHQHRHLWQAEQSIAVVSAADNDAPPAQR